MEHLKGSREREIVKSISQFPSESRNLLDIFISAAQPQTLCQASRQDEVGQRQEQEWVAESDGRIQRADVARAFYFGIEADAMFAVLMHK